ncbi:MAG: hypothetical protein RL219_2171 [Actinomycetota bacterium]
MLTRRQLLVRAGVVPAVAGAAVTAAASPAEAVRYPIIISDSTPRTYGPVMFIGDSTSSLRYRTMKREIAAYGIGPFRLDLQPGRSLARTRRGRPSAIDAVRMARAASFDPEVYVVALGYPDILGWEGNPKPARTVEAIRQLIIPLLTEIGTDRLVAIFNLYSVRRTRSTVFNAALASLVPEWPNLHIVDWASLARRNRHWHARDGYHYGYIGAKQRTNFIGRTLRDMVTLRRTLTAG